MRKITYYLLIAGLILLKNNTVLSKETANNTPHYNDSIYSKFLTQKPQIGITTKPPLKNNTTKNTRKTSLNSNYSTSSYSNKSIGDFVIEINQLSSSIAESITKTKLNNLFSRTFFVTLYNGLFYYPLQVAYHEFGHGTRLAATGQKPSYGIVKSFIPHTTYITEQRYSNFFEYYTALLFNPDFGGGNVTTKEIMFNSNNIPHHYDYMISMGGVNNDMYISEIIEDTIFFNQNAEISYLPHYLDGKLSSLLYTHSELHKNNSGDIREITEYYNQIQNYNISDKDIKKANLISALLSGTTYKLLFANINYIFDLKQKKTSRKFKLPDISNYHTLKGLSYKFKTGYSFNKDISTIIAIESITQGKNYTELSFGIQARINKKNTIKFNSYISNAISADLAISKLITKHFELTLGIDHYNAETLYGERNIPSFKHSKHNTQLYTKLSILY